MPASNCVNSILSYYTVRLLLLDEFGQGDMSIDPGDTPSPEVVGRKQTTIIPLHLKRSLRHPVIFGQVFRGQFEVDQIEFLLRGDEKLLGKLSHQVISWFAHKCYARTDNKVGVETSREIIYRVAKHCVGESSNFKFPADWEVALNGSPMLISHIMAVAKQAESAGLLKGKTGKFQFNWGWKHPMLMKHFVSYCESDEEGQI